MLTETSIWSVDSRHVCYHEITSDSPLSLSAEPTLACYGLLAHTWPFFFSCAHALSFPSSLSLKIWLNYVKTALRKCHFLPGLTLHGRRVADTVQLTWVDPFTLTANTCLICVIVFVWMGHQWLLTRCFSFPLTQLETVESHSKRSNGGSWLLSPAEWTVLKWLQINVSSLLHKLIL